MRLHLLGAFTGALLLMAPAQAQIVTPAQAQDKVPSAAYQEVLVKTSLLTLNDANVTGNYTVLHAKLAKPFREQFSPDKLKQVFKKFAEQNIDWGIIAAKTPIATKETVIDNRGRLVMRGYFDTTPSRMIYEIDFIPSENEWKPVKLNVNIKPVNEG